MIDYSMKLSEHFTLGEFTIKNLMPPESKRFFTEQIITAALPALTFSAKKMEEVRALLGKPIKVHCGLRPYLWELFRKRTGTSQHSKGQAIDFSCSGYGSPLEIAKYLSKNKHILQYDQLIYEYSWIHISWVEKNPRMKDLTLSLRTNVYDLGIHG